METLKILVAFVLSVAAASAATVSLHRHVRTCAFSVVTRASTKTSHSKLSRGSKIWLSRNFSQIMHWKCFQCIFSSLLNKSKISLIILFSILFNLGFSFCWSLPSWALYRQKVAASKDKISLAALTDLWMFSREFLLLQSLNSLKSPRLTKAGKVPRLSLKKL